MKHLTVIVAMVLVISASSTLFGADVALLDSNVNTRNFFQQHYVFCGGDTPSTLGADEYKRYFLGWKYVLDGLKVTDPVKYAYDIIQDSDVTESGLANFKLLILSNNVSLSDSETDVIDKWVRQGGRLLATFGSGYKGILTDPRQADGLKLQEGGTGGLHQLWHDPLSHLFSTRAIDPAHPELAGVDVMITRSSGPTQGVSGLLTGYGDLGNMLIQRPENNPEVYALLVLNPALNWDRPQPAILSTKASKGLVVYYAFAPEFIVALEFDLAGHCSGDPNYPPVSATNLFAGRSVQLRPLMMATINYLLNP